MLLYLPMTTSPATIVIFSRFLPFIFWAPKSGHCRKNQSVLGPAWCNKTSTL